MLAVGGGSGVMLKIVVEMDESDEKLEGNVE